MSLPKLLLCHSCVTLSLCLLLRNLEYTDFTSLRSKTSTDFGNVPSTCADDCEGLVLQSLDRDPCASAGRWIFKGTFQPYSSALCTDVEVGQQHCPSPRRPSGAWFQETIFSEGAGCKHSKDSEEKSNFQEVSVPTPFQKDALWTGKVSLCRVNDECCMDSNLRCPSRDRSSGTPPLQPLFPVLPRLCKQGATI